MTEKETQRILDRIAYWKERNNSVLQQGPALSMNAQLRDIEELILGIRAKKEQ